ncbi:MAG TPA: lysophospholipid acyltransferase family protein [Planctomycetota bacterium]|nr:lysophospholipid acyltransferase family protein [Planctomycetota bacterium]
MYSAAPKRKERSIVIDRVVAALARLIVRVLNILPAPVARSLGRAVGRMAWRCSGYYRRRVLANMDIAFRNEKTRAEKEALCTKYFEHVGLTVVEFARMTRLTPQNVTELCDLSELRQFDEILAKKRGLLCVPAHHGNWELCGYSVALMGYPLKSVARPLDNPLLNDFIMEHRQKSGNVIIEKWKVLWKLKKMLDKGDIVTMSVDQNGGVAGMFVPFFGSLASTVASPADLHVITGTPIIVATLNRKPDGIHHVLRVWDVIEHAQTGDQKADSRRVLTRINAAVERSIREYPEQWLWIHKRWKTRPLGEAPCADGLPPLIASKS